MKFINFNNIHQALPAKQEVLEAHNKQPFFEINQSLNLRLSSKQIDNPSNYVDYTKFSTGHIYAEENECIIDVDTQKGVDYVANLVLPFMTKICVEKTLRGYHFYIKLAPGHNFKGKKDIKHNDFTIEYKGEGSYVYSSAPKGVLSYYYQLEYSTPDRLLPLTPEETQTFLSQLMPQQSMKQDLKDSKDSTKSQDLSRIFSNKALSIFVKNSVKENFIMEEVLLKYFNETLKYNSYQGPFKGILNGDEGGKGRNNTLYDIMTTLLYCADIEDKELIYDFILILNRDYCQPPLPKDQMNTSFGLKRLNELKNYTLEDYHKFKPNPSDSPDSSEPLVEFYMDSSSDSKDKECYYIVKTIPPNFNDYDSNLWKTEWSENGKKKILIRSLNKNPHVILSELLEEPKLHKYITVNSKGAYTGVKWIDVPMLTVKNRTARLMSPSVPVFSYSKVENRAILDFGSSHYSEDLRGLFNSPNPLETYPCPSLEEFMNIPFVKMALINLFGTVEKMALQLGEIYRCFNQRKSTNRIFAFLGSGGIGKDTWIDFLAHCFLQPLSNCYYKRSQEEFLQEKFNMSASNASILFLNESGNGDPLSPKLLNKLNAYVGNNVMSSEAKFQDVQSIRLHLLTVALASNNLTFERGSYNNTRLILYVCPGERPLRNNIENLKFFFGDLDEEDAFKKWSVPFMTFVLTNPYFYNLIKDKNFNEIDDSEFLEKSSRESSDCEELDEYYTITDELSKDSMDYIVTHLPTRPPKNWSNLEDQMIMLKNLLYFNLFKELGGDTLLLRKSEPVMRLMSKTQINIKPDNTIHSRLFLLSKYSNIIRRGKELSGEYCSKKEADAENAERLVRPLRHTLVSKIVFSDKLLNRYYIEGLKIKIKEQFKNF